MARLFVHISNETEVFAKTPAASVLSVHRLVRWVAEAPGVLSRNQEYVDGQETPVNDESYHGCAWGRDSYALMVTSEHVFVSALFQRDLRSLKDIRAGRVSWTCLPRLGLTTPADTVDLVMAGSFRLFISSMGGSTPLGASRHPTHKWQMGER